MAYYWSWRTGPGPSQPWSPAVGRSALGPSFPRSWPTLSCHKRDFFSVRWGKSLLDLVARKVEILGIIDCIFNKMLNFSTRLDSLPNLCRHQNYLNWCIASRLLAFVLYWICSEIVIHYRHLSPFEDGSFVDFVWKHIEERINWNHNVYCYNLRMFPVNFT